MIFTAKLKVLIALMLVSLAIQASHANPNDFTVQSVTSTNVFKLSEAKGKLVALHFLLKTECPCCIRHTHDSPAIYGIAWPDARADGRVDRL